MFKGQFHEELKRVFDLFPEYHTKILLRDFNANVGREDTFKTMIGNEGPYESLMIMRSE
jgi:hypothetical protein